MVNSRIRNPFDVIFLNPDYVDTRSLRSHFTMIYPSDTTISFRALLYITRHDSFRTNISWLFDRTVELNRLKLHNYTYLIFFYLLHSTGQNLQLPRGKGHKRTSRSHTKVPHLTHPPFTYERQPQHRDHPTLYEGFFYVPQNYQHSRNCETGPPAYRPYVRRLESLIICR